MATITLTSEEQTINLVTEGSVSLSASNGKSAYQSYLSTTTDDPVLTEAEWSGGGGGDYVATNDSRLTDARTPTSHVHGGISNAGAIGSTAGLPIKTGTSGVLEVGAFGTSSGQFAQGNDSRFHDRSHAMTSTSDHTAGNWKVFHSNDSGQLVELALGADGTYLKSNGASAAPTFATPAGGGSSITGTGFAYVRSGGDDSTAVIGNPALPYLTAQAAWDDGAIRFDFGVGSFSIDAAFGSGGYSAPIYVQGAGIGGSIVTLTWRGEDGVEQNGFTAPDLNLSSDKSVYLQVAIEGGDATSAGSDTYNGGNVAGHYFVNCYIGTLALTPGAGCNGGTAGTDATSCGAEFTNIVTGALQGSTIYKYAILEAGVFSPDKLSDGDKGHITVSASGTTWSVNQNALQLDTLVAATAKGKIVGRKTAGAGNFEECAITDFIDAAVVTTSNITDTTGAVANVSGMSFSIAANEKVSATFRGFWATNTSGSGFKYAFTGPASPTDVQIGDFSFTSATAVRTESGTTAFSTTATQGGGTLLNSAMPITIQIYVRNGSTPGTVQLQIGGEVFGSTFTLYKGFTMQVLRIP